MSSPVFTGLFLYLPMNYQLTILDWVEFINPDHIVFTMSDYRQVTIRRTQILGGDAAYKWVQALLDNFCHENCKLKLEEIINGLIVRLN